MIQELQDQHENDGLAYFYYAFDDTRLQSPMHMVKSMVYQLATRTKKFPQVVANMFDRAQDQHGLLDIDNYIEIFQAYTDIFPKTYLVIDALDECSSSDGLKEVFHKMIYEKSLKLNILSFSRDKRQTAQLLRQLNFSTLHLNAVDSDIENFVSHQIQTNPRFHMLPASLRAEVTTKIVAESNGL